MSAMTRLSALTIFVLAILVFPLSNARHRRNGVNRQVSDATNIFSINLLKEVFDNDPGNVVVSPVSISTVLTIVQQVSSTNTRKQLTQVLYAGPQALRAGYSNIIHDIKDSGDNATLEFTNGVFLQYGLDVLESFRKLLKDFRSEVETVNFFKRETAANIINLWIAENTHGRIKDLIKPGSLSTDMQLILANAVYFKGLWKVPFIEQFTKPEPFYTENGAEVLVTMMHLDASLKEGYIDSIHSRWIEIPFEGNKYSMLVVMPSGKTTFSEMVKKFTAQHLSTTMDIINITSTSDIFLSLPKFKVTTEIDFVPTLMKLGLTDIFTTKSDLTRITGDPLHIDQVVQKAEIEVDEQGTTASASTGLGVVAISAPAPFEVNHPFMFFIIDNINAIPLFAGKVTNPSY